MIRQGEVYWLDLSAAPGSGPAYRHPHLVLQNDAFNSSRLRTTVVCTLTSNLGRAEAPGNVRLEPAETGLAKPSVANVSQLYTVDTEELVERVGVLPPVRLREVLRGIELLLEPREAPRPRKL